jgi:hypothetical protein
MTDKTHDDSAATEPKTAPDAAADAPPTVARPVSPRTARRGRGKAAAALEATEATPEPEVTTDAAALRRKARPKPPSFGISQGTAEELARTGRAVDPFTGNVLEDTDRLAELAAQAKAAGESNPREH